MLCKFAKYSRRWHAKGSTSTEENASNSRLLMLPAELRNKIYGYVSDGAIIYINTWSRQKRIATSTAPLRQTCRQLRCEVGTQAREAVLILRQGSRLATVLKVLELKPDAFTQNAKRNIRARDVSRWFGVQEPYRLRINLPVVLLYCGTSGLVGRHLGDMEIVKVVCFRRGTEAQGLVGLRDLFTKPGVAEVLFGG
jgi:hypothetical protein